MGRLASGQLQERVTLLTTATVVADESGYGYVPGGDDIEQLLWARVRPLKEYEKLRLGLVANSDSYEVTIRNRPDVSASQRLKWKGQTLNITGVRPDENREYLLLTCFDSGR